MTNPAAEPPAFAPGLRFSLLDGCVLVLAAVAMGVGAMFVWWIALAIGLTVGHFYLFCNVFRLSRALELVWAAIFVTLAAATILTGSPGWLLTTLISLGVTVVVVAIEMRRPSYHGVAWEVINPDLPQWWHARLREADDEAT
jgi:hypothetical protein